MSELTLRLGDPNAILLFQGLPRDAVLAALKGCSLRELRAGSTLLQPGENNSSIYIVLAGELAAHLDAGTRMYPRSRSWRENVSANYPLSTASRLRHWCARPLTPRCWNCPTRSSATRS